MSTKKSKTKPVETLRDGAIKAAIWRNEREDGKPFFGVTFSRSYKTAKGEYKDTNSFSGRELLSLARLAEKAYDRAADLRRAAAAAEKAEDDED